MFQANKRYCQDPLNSLASLPYAFPIPILHSKNYLIADLLIFFCLLLIYLFLIIAQILSPGLWMALACGKLPPVTRLGASTNLRYLNLSFLEPPWKSLTFRVCWLLQPGTTCITPAITTGHRSHNFEFPSME
jgi:hypothetical protein